MAGLPPPFSFGVDDKYSEWRPHQDRVVERITDSDRRIIMPVCPTGFGKSLAYVVGGMINGGRVVVLTSTRALQDQLARDHGDILADIRGKNNYKCNLLGGYATCDKGPCNWGMKCHLAFSGCEYYDQVKLALTYPIISTNYSYWLNRRDWGGEGAETEFSMLVCDEAHELPEIMSSFLTKEIKWGKSDREGIRNAAVESFPDRRAEVGGWIKHHHSRVKTEHAQVTWDIKEGGQVDEYTLSRAKYLTELLDFTSFVYETETEDPNNLVIYKRGDTVMASVVWPYRYTESKLFKGVERVVMTSATITTKTLSLLGVEEEEVELVDTPHPFPVENRRLIHIPTIRLNYRSSDMELLKWRTRIDQIVGKRLDRKGIIHTVSYKRSGDVMGGSRYKSRMVSHGSKDAQKTIIGFKENPEPGVLVSPVVTTGYDFPGAECRYQVIGKIAYPDTSDPIIKKRMEMDRDYASYIAMQRLIQTCGRGVRSVDDWCENFIIDDNVSWFFNKYKSFAPKWFQESMVGVKAKNRSTPMEEDVPEPRGLE